MPYQRMTRPEFMLEKLILLNEHSWEDESDLKVHVYALGFLVNHEPDKSREIAKNIWNQTPSVSEAPEPLVLGPKIKPLLSSGPNTPRRHSPEPRKALRGGDVFGEVPAFPSPSRTTGSLSGGIKTRSNLDQEGIAAQDVAARTQIARRTSTTRKPVFAAETPVSPMRDLLDYRQFL